MARQVDGQQMASQRIAAIDIDGVVADLVARLKKCHEDRFGCLPDDPHMWDIAECWGKTERDLWYELWRCGGYDICPLVEGAAEGLQVLRGAGWEVKLVTARGTPSDPMVAQRLYGASLELSAETAQQRTKVWLEGERIPYDSIVFSDRKADAHIEYDLIVDDNPNTIQDALRAGRRALCFRQSWNADEIRKLRLPYVTGWPDLLRSART